MKALMKATGPRDCSLVEVTVHIASLSNHYRENRKVFETESLSFEVRQAAYAQSVKAFDLLNRWKEVRADILKRGGATRKKVKVM